MITLFPVKKASMLVPEHGPLLARGCWPEQQEERVSSVDPRGLDQIVDCFRLIFLFAHLLVLEGKMK